MIDWDELIGAENRTGNSENAPISGARPTASSIEAGKMGRTESNVQAGFDDSAPLAPLAPLKKQGIGFEQENHAPGEGLASDNYCAAKTYPVNPIAVTLLLTCCHKATVSKEETLEAIWKLQTIPQHEQIKSWAILCQNHGINPHKVIRPFTEHRGTGTSCQGCKHISVELIPTGCRRPVYRYVCGKQHHMLEAFYIGERVLIAPELCTDYQSKSGE
jgi:hypothetical protein